MSILPIRTIGAGLLLTGATGAATAALVSSLANQRLKSIPKPKESIDADLAAILELSKAEEVANQRLKSIPKPKESIDADLAAILELSKAEEVAKIARQKQEETALQDQLGKLKKKLGERVKDDGRCLFYAARVDAEKVLDMLADEGKDVTSMRGPKKNYPFAEREHCEAIARYLDSTLRVYTFGYYENFGSRERVVEVALLGNHYWPVKDA